MGDQRSKHANGSDGPFIAAAPQGCVNRGREKQDSKEVLPGEAVSRKAQS